MKLVECVPNFSEGRDRAVIDAITREIEQVSGVKLLDVDPGAETNRTVVTFVGTPEGVRTAAFRAIAKAAELIDMAKHTGAHPRIGATDVCPFVPVTGVSMEECAQIARDVGRRVGEELGIPVYLYEEAATRPERRSLANVRQGEYEGLAARLTDPAWQPDYGPAVFNPRTGATVIGAREFLIAYNFNLNTRDRRLANEIALAIREAGRLKRGARGEIVRDAQGNPERVPGRFKSIRAVGWYIPEYGRAQISVNFTNYRVASLHAVYEAVVEEAAARGLVVTGSELVGLIPRDALLDAGRHFLIRQGKSAGVPERELIHVAVLSLGLNDVAPFDPAKKIIEYQFSTGGRLVSMPVRDFADELSTDSPAPGGGSVAALCGALGAALAAMVANLTVGKKGYEAAGAEMQDVAQRGQLLKDEFLADVDRDTEAFDRVMDAFRLPARTDAEKQAKAAALQTATRGATLVPLGVLRRTGAVLELLAAVAQRGNRNSVSDAGVGALVALAGAEGACYNVLVNLATLDDPAFVEATRAEADRLINVARRAAAAVRAVVEKALGR